MLFREILLVERALATRATAAEQAKGDAIDVDAIADLADALHAFAREWRRSFVNGDGLAGVSSAAAAALFSLVDRKARRGRATTAAASPL